MVTGFVLSLITLWSYLSVYYLIKCDQIAVWSHPTHLNPRLLLLKLSALQVTSFSMLLIKLKTAVGTSTTISPGLTIPLWYSQSRNPHKHGNSLAAQYLCGRNSPKILGVTFDSQRNSLNQVSNVNTKVQEHHPTSSNSSWHLLELWPRSTARSQLNYRSLSVQLCCSSVVQHSWTE